MAAGSAFTYRVVAKELTVAAVTKFPIFLGSGGWGAGATFRAAVLILPKPLICLTGLWCMAACTVWEFMTLAGRVPVRERGGKGGKKRHMLDFQLLMDMVDWCLMSGISWMNASILKPHPGKIEILSVKGLSDYDRKHVWETRTKRINLWATDSLPDQTTSQDCYREK